jgi:exonuclease III
LGNINNKLKVLTYNTWGLKVGPFSIAKDYSARIYSLPSEIFRLAPDIIFLQEIWKKSDREYLINELGKRGYQFSFYKSDQHPKVRQWKGYFKWLNKLMLGNGLLIISKNPINLASGKVFSFSAHTATEEFFTRKGALFCEINVPGIGDVNCVNTHLGSVDYNNKKLRFHSKQKHMQDVQLNELDHFIKALPKDKPLFIGADLNIDEQNNQLSDWFPKKGKDYIKILDKLALTDSYRFIHPDKIGKTYSSKNDYKKKDSSPDGRIDYLFHANLGHFLVPKSSNLVFNEPIQKRNQTFFLSDHFGILSEYQIIKKGV